MSRLEVKTPGQAQAIVEQLYRNMERRIAASPPGLCPVDMALNLAIVEQLYRNMERRIAASPPGLCPVDMALNFLRLCQAQTCGKCVPCRIGLTQLSRMIQEVLDGEPEIDILRRIETTAQVIVDTADCAIGIDAANLGLTQLSRMIQEVLDGEPEIDILRRIETTAQVIVDTADCAIGIDAANLVLMGLKGFRDDFEEHILHHRCLGSLRNPVPCVALCPAGVDIPGYISLVNAGRCDDAVRLIRKDNPFPTACAYICEHPCEARCRRNVDIPGYISLVNAGRCDDAVRLIRKDNPFPTACAYICEHPCEARCRRNMVDDALNIRGLKRYAVDHAGNVPQPKCAPATGKKIAVIGGGPGGLSAAYYLALMGHHVAIYEKRQKLGGMMRYGIPSYRFPRELLDGGPGGLSAAYYLALMGHHVAIYEKRQKLGGMMRYGIPSYRFPRELLDAEIESILSLGIEVHTGMKVGNEISFDELKANYDCLYISIGAHTDKKVGIEGEDSIGVISAVQMLGQIGDDIMPDFTDQNVVVVGGGNVAMDVTRSAIGGRRQRGHGRHPQRHPPGRQKGHLCLPPPSGRYDRPIRGGGGRHRRGCRGTDPPRAPADRV